MKKIAEIKKKIFEYFKQPKEDFFEQMESHKISSYNSSATTAYLAFLSCGIATIVVFIVAAINQIFNTVIIILLAVFSLLAIIAMLFYIILIFIKNGILFKMGILSSGLISFGILVGPIYLILLICYICIPLGGEVIIALLAAVTTISAAILTIMGVHYTLAQQKKERTDKNNLVFELYESEESESVFRIKNSRGDLELQIKIKNISGNYGYMIGIYKLCGCDVYQIGDDFPYLSMSPNKCLAISDIRVNNGDDQLVLVYKDIGENYYYLLFSVSGLKICVIEKAGKCDFKFLRNQLHETNETEKAMSSKGETEKSIKRIDPLQLETIDKIKDRKEETKPNRIMNRDGFDLIVSNDGEIRTDIKLLSLLKKERLRLAKEKKVKAYMIFNNQQLVALATYKPKDESSFVSIYGLGQKKYDLYGKVFVQIIKAQELSESDVT